MLDIDADITTHCPDCGSRFVLRVEAGSLVQTDGVIHFAVPAKHWWDDVEYT